MKKNIDKLVNEILLLEQEEAYQAGAIGYMSRALTLATMPHRRIESNEFKRQNGVFKLTMLADSDVGLPYGNIPRLLMLWITTEAVRTKERQLILGKTLSEFMFALDMIPSGGRWGSITRLKEQMKRLFSSSISCSYSDGKNWSVKNIIPVEEADLWWDPKNPQQATIWESRLLLGNKFFEEIIENPIPIDTRALKLIRQSPMAIDIYCWLTYRMSYLNKTTSIPWSALQFQFGSNYKDVRQFKRKFIKQLKKVTLIYPEANIKEENGSLVLSPGKPHINKTHRKNDKNKIRKAKTIKHKKEDEKIKNNQQLQIQYENYRIDTLLEIIKNMPNKNEYNRLLKLFRDNLNRKGMNEIRLQIIQGKYNKTAKEALYQFINTHHHYILNPIKTYEEFCKMIAK